MSDIQIGVETKLSGTGMDQAEKKVRDLTGEVRKLEDATHKNTVEAGNADKSNSTLGESIGKVGDKSKSASQLMAQLNQALSGNATSAGQAIKINEQLFNTLTVGFGLLGAAITGWKIGSKIFTEIIDPIWAAVEASNNLKEAANDMGVSVRRAASDDVLQKMKGLTEVQGKLADEHKRASEEAQREYQYQRQLTDLQFELEESKLRASMPAGSQRDAAIAELQQRRTGSVAKIDESEMQRRRDEAETRVAEAKKRYDDASAMESARRASGQQRFNELQSQMKWSDKNMPEQERARLDFAMSQAAKDARGSGSGQLVEELQKQLIAAISEQTQVLREQQLTGIKNTISRTDAATEVGVAKQEIQRDKLEREKDLLDKQMQSIRSGENPLAVSAIRERAEAQSVQNYMSNNPGQRAASRSGDYARELKEAQAAEKALQNLTQTLLKKLNDVAAQLKMLDEKVANVPVQ
jgi:hypothetical protein